MNKIKIAVLVSGGGTNLQAIIDAINSGVIKHAEVGVVISNKQDAYALTRAATNNIPNYFVSKKITGSQEIFENQITDLIESYNCKLIVLAGFLSILSERFTKHFDHKIINIHPSLIPSFCGQGFYGLKVHQAALSRGVKITGATVHFVNEIPDGGEIIMQKTVEVLDADTPESLQKRVMEQAEWIILPLSIEKLASEKLMEN